MAKSFKDQKKFVSKEQFRLSAEIENINTKKRIRKETENVLNLKDIKSFNDIMSLESLN